MDILPNTRRIRRLLRPHRDDIPHFFDLRSAVHQELVLYSGRTFSSIDEAIQVLQEECDEHTGVEAIS